MDKNVEILQVGAKEQKTPDSFKKILASSFLIFLLIFQHFQNLKNLFTPILQGFEVFKIFFIFLLKIILKYANPPIPQAYNK